MQLTKDIETAAQAAFMAAKCEQNQFLINKAFNGDDYGSSFKVPGSFRNNFRLLKQNFSDTKYYQEIIVECSYFADFVRKN